MPTSGSNPASRILLAGVARVSITPPLGIRMWGYTVQDDCARDVERDLTATVLVLSDGYTSVLIAAVDLLFIPMALADSIRQSIEERTGIPAANILLNGGHTHLGPMLPGWQEEASPQNELQSRYARDLERLLGDAAEAAWSNRQPARIGSARGSAPLGVNRREKLPDGSVIVGENLSGPIDHTVDVLRVDDLSGGAMAVVMAAACHTITLGPKTLSLSPDFVGPARDIVESDMGGLSLFLQASAGNINPVCGIGAGGPEQFDNCRRLGAMLGGETVKLLSQICTHRLRGPRRIVRSVAALSVWDYEEAPKESLSHFSVTRRRLTLPLSPLPDRATIEAELAQAKSAYDKAIAGDSQGAKNVAARRLAYSEQRQRLVAGGVSIPTRDIELWAMRINDIGIAAVSAEPLVELGLEIKRRSPLSHTMFLGYSNGCIGYIPPPEAFAEGGMEVVDSHVNYGLPSQLTPDWAPKVIDETLDMLAKLT